MALKGMFYGKNIKLPYIYLAVIAIAIGTLQYYGYVLASLVYTDFCSVFPPHSQHTFLLRWQVYVILIVNNHAIHICTLVI